MIHLSIYSHIHCIFEVEILCMGYDEKDEQMKNLLLYIITMQT